VISAPAKTAPIPGHESHEDRAFYTQPQLNDSGYLHLQPTLSQQAPPQATYRNEKEGARYLHTAKTVPIPGQGSHVNLHDNQF
jgi:hypothetical protein